ncbi:TetR family transcriptional regulator C-terminal domain-containing protein [Larkinella rosea]|uniref:TetR/AcrR family transcriptional regulator n=1 Tax=Larkinella rosea TaxID=2025312 RepID=A0A3P1C0L1_9BACT|nr:TetR family transcriptional regulator C-terminal domain-containing protein [Larkinella rosea]RRB06940.1 TetR/AcrR family transcriptional regulator [Larkinella rosea]
MEKLEKIRKAYIDYVLENGTPPPSVFQFAKKLKISEADFYQEFTSFESIEADIWRDYFRQALQTVETDPIYQTYSVREKLLAFYYTWIEVLKAQRSFAVFSYNRLRQAHAQASPMTKARMGNQSSRVLQLFKESYFDYVRDLLAEGRESKEVEPRPFLSDRYADGLWTQTLFILHFWINDVSKNFEKTDTAIEKSVNTAFDLIGRSPLDSLFDLAKFIFQNK